jgi:hypothetical protein
VTRLRRASVSWCLLLAAAATANAELITPAPSVDVIVERMSAAREENRARFQSFEVLRSYRLCSRECENTKSEITADISYGPAGAQSYSIHKASGVPMGETIVRKILEGEKEVLANPSASDISPNNYSFSLIGTDSVDGHPCYLLGLKPRRKDHKLLVGTVWIDASNYLIVRVEGQPSQPVSFWIHNVHITLEFQQVHGMWIQAGFRSTGDVRLLGQHTMISHDVEYKMGEIEAKIRPSY